MHALRLVPQAGRVPQREELLLLPPLPVRRAQEPQEVEGAAHEDQGAGGQGRLRRPPEAGEDCGRARRGGLGEPAPQARQHHAEFHKRRRSGRQAGRDGLAARDWRLSGAAADLVRWLQDARHARRQRPSRMPSVRVVPQVELQKRQGLHLLPPVPPRGAQEQKETQNPEAPRRGRHSHPRGCYAVARSQVHQVHEIGAPRPHGPWRQRRRQPPLDMDRVALRRGGLHAAVRHVWRPVAGAVVTHG
mmetsp:Transcript_48669/g.139075  ORF Transcript_48669/g.139075 Transcript_48669/m.139075 type:complete len:246 (+) Transcript_48669:236-973(+)